MSPHLPCAQVSEPSMPPPRPFPSMTFPKPWVYILCKQGPPEFPTLSAQTPSIVRVWVLLCKGMTFSQECSHADDQKLEFPPLLTVAPGVTDTPST